MNLPIHPPEAFRQKVWDLLEGNASAGNLQKGRIMGNGMPDAIYAILKQALAKERVA